MPWVNSNRAERNSFRQAFVLAVLASVLVACASLSHAQSAGPPAEPQSGELQEQPAARLKANTNEVVLDLVVRDRGHETVPQLNPEDLAVFDEGAPVKLQDLHLVKVGADPAKKPLVTFVFDPFHGAIAKSTRTLALGMLTLLPSQGFRMAVMDFDGRMRLIQGFTEDREAVQNAVMLETDSNPMVLNSTLSLAVSIVNDEKADEARKNAVDKAEKNLIAIAQTGSDPAGQPTTFEDRQRAQALLDAMQNADTLAHQHRIQYTVAGLMALVNAQQSLRERRIIIYFTANRHLGPVSDRMLDDVAKTAAAAGISIYTIDMDATGRAPANYAVRSGITSRPLGGQASGTPPGSAPGPSGTDISGASYQGYQWTTRDTMSEMTDFMRSSGEDSGGGPFESLHNPMEGVSKETGAAYIDALNSTRRALRDLAQDLTSYYEATFVPSTRNYDGKFRRITIKPSRSDLSVRGRNGYFALPPGVDPGVKSFELPLLNVFNEAKLPRDFDFRAAVLRFGDLPNGNINSLAIEIPLAALQVSPDPTSNHPEARVAILATVRDKSGVIVEHYADEITRRDVQSVLSKNADAVIALDHHFISAPGHYTLEIAARDENSSKTSAQHSEFDVVGQPGALAVSDMVMVRALDPISVVNLDPLEPLLFSRKKVTPGIGAEVAQTSKGPSVFFLLHPRTASNTALHLDMQLVRNGIAGKRTPMLNLDGVQSAVPYMASLGATPLPAGDYEVKAFLAQDGQTAEQSLRFHVAGTLTASVEPPSPTPITVTDDSQIALDSDNQIAAVQPLPTAQLPISAVSATQHPLPMPEANLLIEGARQHALDYESDVLSHFTCIEITRRSVDPKGTGRWRLEDTITERLEYHRNVETRTTLQVNGQTTRTARQNMNGTLSTGEFGGVLRAVFRPASQAAFTWKGSADLKGATVQVYEYRVDRAHSDFSITATDGKQVVVAFHGEVYVDETSRRARRITLIADGLPPSFLTRSTSISVDYDYVAINGLKYLMPIGARLQVTEGENHSVINTMEFSDYRRANPL